MTVGTEIVLALIALIELGVGVGFAFMVRELRDARRQAKSDRARIEALLIEIAETKGRYRADAACTREVLREANITYQKLLP